MPSSSTRDDIKYNVDANEFEAEIDEEHLGVCEEAVYEDLTDLEGAMF